MRSEELAINGGKSTREKMLPYGHQDIDEEDINAVINVLRSDWITQGPKVAEFEKKIADFVGVKYAVAVNSGTSALHAACFAAGIGKNDEVITTPITFVASANCILYMGGTPVFSDIKLNSYNIDPEDIENKITKRTKAIIPVDFAGHPADLEEINSIAKKHNLIIIEDAAHALGATYKGKKVGSISDMTVFSFHPVKHITTGEGGMIVTNNSDFYEKLKLFVTHGITKDKNRLINYEGPWYYEMQELGYNYRLTDFQCALGISQLNKLEKFINRRREIATYYNEELKDVEEIILPPEERNVKSVWHIYVIRLKLDKLKVSRREIFEALRAENIGVQVHYIPIYWQPYYQKLGYKKGLCPNAEKYYEEAITLPIFPAMSDGDAEDVVKAVKKVINYYSKRKEFKK
jgi:UDP-4-amino-4,6-dideoxy-N-acetyl-beta-L-altrosamine transaminase